MSLPILCNDKLLRTVRYFQELDAPYRTWTFFLLMLDFLMSDWEMLPACVLRSSENQSWYWWQDPSSSSFWAIKSWSYITTSEINMRTMSLFQGITVNIFLQACLSYLVPTEPRLRFFHNVFVSLSIWSSRFWFTGEQTGLGIFYLLFFFFLSFINPKLVKLHSCWPDVLHEEISITHSMYAISG